MQEKTIPDKSILNCKPPRELGVKEIGDVLYKCFTFLIWKQIIRGLVLEITLKCYTAASETAGIDL